MSQIDDETHFSIFLESLDLFGLRLSSQQA